MPPTAKAGPDAVARSVLFLTSPCLWPNWPYLPVVRRRPGKAEELGVVIDLWRSCGLPGYSAMGTAVRDIVIAVLIDRLVSQSPRPSYTSGRRSDRYDRDRDRDGWDD